MLHCYSYIIFANIFNEFVKRKKKEYLNRISWFLGPRKATFKELISVALHIFHETTNKCKYYSVKNKLEPRKKSYS